MSKYFGNYERCVWQAEQFLVTAEMCLSVNEDSPLELIFPLFVNAAFACELYLKAIMMSETLDNSFCGGHHLGDLFSKISEHAQNCVRDNYSRQALKISLDKLLEKYSNTFPEWRYSFQKGAEGNYLGTIGFARSLKEYIDSTKDMK